ncbi:MAG TPA: Flp pilus assembly complex ATPase component TadA, partial [Firmicutes bacterium]|nr:Flp pilus assembly complex ATPase component TadA [Bacillota bacterium]
MRRYGVQDLLGRRLVQEGVITEEQLEKALRYREEHEGDRLPLGKVLVRLGYCKEEDIARVIARRAGVPFVSLENYAVNEAAMVTVPADIARRYRALPINFTEDGRLLVAMEQPLDILALDDLRVLTGYNIQPVAVTDSELEAAINNYSQASVSVEGITDEYVSPEDDPAEEAHTANVDAEKPAVQLANIILSQAVNSKASDVHIEVYEKTLRVRFRIDGVLHDVMSPPRRMHGPLVSRFKIMANMNIAERRVPQDGRMSIRVEGRTVDVRVATMPASFG